MFRTACVFLFALACPFAQAASSSGALQVGLQIVGKNKDALANASNSSSGNHKEPAFKSSGLIKDGQEPVSRHKGKGFCAYASALKKSSAAQAWRPIRITVTSLASGEEVFSGDFSAPVQKAGAPVEFVGSVMRETPYLYPVSRGSSEGVILQEGVLCEGMRVDGVMHSPSSGMFQIILRQSEAAPQIEQGAFTQPASLGVNISHLAAVLHVGKSHEHEGYRYLLTTLD